MIIEKLTLHDFGVYRGRHEIDLHPDSPEKPIVLIGARNGRGKTTILDAINVVLFGSRGRISSRARSVSWDTYLRHTINTDAGTSALVSMQFTIEDDFETRVYDITRSWELVGKSVKEYFDVSVNGVPDKILAEDWDEHIEGLLPLDVASLNFFDGEQINSIADPELSRNVVMAAIRGLLGLGVLERLEADLKVFLRRKQDEVIGESASPELLGLETEISDLEHRRVGIENEIDHIRPDISAKGQDVARIEEKARAVGADKWEQRAEWENLRNELGNSQATLESELHSLAEGVAPLRLVLNLMQQAKDQMYADEKVHTTRILLAELKIRDAAILQKLSSDVAKVVQPVLEDDCAERENQALVDTVHESGTAARTLMVAALRDAEEISDVAEKLTNLDLLETRINDVERSLMSVPTGDQLAPVLEELGRERAKYDSLLNQEVSLTDELAHITTTLERLNVQSKRLREVEADKQKGALENQRSREYAQRALETVVELSRVTIGRNLSQIETAIFERFQQLIGKKNLVTSVQIDRDTLELRVSKDDGELLPIERLSAGERQLLATATLWGLSLVAGRSIPLVVDTPLGRLDNQHRVNLATNYFPFAAQQVVILSTDTEFDPELYGVMKHAVGKEYLIMYREESRGSEIVPGYFEGATADAS